MDEYTRTGKTLRLPKVGEYVRRVGRLLAIEDPPPAPPPPREYVFEDRTARCELRRNGKCIDQIQTLNDHYGEGSGEKECIKDMLRYVAEEKIGPDSELEVVVIRVIQQYRMRPTNTANCFEGEFHGFESLPYGSKRGLPDAVETVVWSSRSPVSASPSQQEKS